MSASAIAALVALGVGFLLGFLPLILFRLALTRRIAQPANLIVVRQAGWRGPALPRAADVRAGAFRILEDVDPLARGPGEVFVIDADPLIALDAPCWTCGRLLGDGDHGGCD